MDKQNTLLHFKYGIWGMERLTLRFPSSPGASAFLLRYFTHCKPQELIQLCWVPPRWFKHQEAFIALETHKSTFSSGCACLCDSNPSPFRAKPSLCLMWVSSRSSGLWMPLGHLCPIWSWHCSFQSRGAVGLRARTARNALRAGMGTALQLIQDWFLSCYTAEFSTMHPSSIAHTTGINHKNKGNFRLS